MSMIKLKKGDKIIERTKDDYDKVKNNTKTKFLLDVDKLQQYVKPPKYKY